MSSSRYLEGFFPFDASCRALGLDALRPLFVHEEFDVYVGPSLLPGDGFSAPEAHWSAWNPGALQSLNWLDTIRKTACSASAANGGVPAAGEQQWAGMVRRVVPPVSTDEDGDYNFEIFTRVSWIQFPALISHQDAVGDVFPYIGLILSTTDLTTAVDADGPFIAAGIKLAGVNSDEQAVAQVQFSKWIDSATFGDEEVYPCTPANAVYLRIRGFYSASADETTLVCDLSFDGLGFAEMNGIEGVLEGQLASIGVAGCCSDNDPTPAYSPTCAIDFIRGRKVESADGGLLSNVPSGARNYPG